MEGALDRSAWRPIHTRIALALGFGWALDSFEVQIVNSVITPIAAEFGLSDTEKILVYLPWFAGILVGALVFGFLADRLGRKRLFVVTLLFYSFFAMLTAASWNLESLLTFRFLTGAGVGGEYAVVASAIAEFVPARHRGRTNALVMNFWALGGITAGAAGILFLTAFSTGGGWRLALLFGAVSAFFALYVRRVIPESPRWLAARGRHEEARAVIREITGEDQPDALEDLLQPQASLGPQLRELWSDYRGRLIYGMTLDFSEAAAYYGIFTFTAVFVLTDGVIDVADNLIPVYFLVANVGALAGGLTVAWALDRFGRKPTTFFTYSGAAVAVMLLAGAASTGSPGLTLVALTLAVFCATTAWVGAYPTFTELFPTHLRATGVGVSVAVGRVGAIIGNVVLGLSAAAFGLFTGFALLAAFWLIGAVAAAVWWVRGIEGRGRSLETLSPPPAYSSSTV
ncbi:MAG: MFS transporter [Solirubrobacteraceae bacterium MAG38_C4-C5]|nr:MFS transporter [Candidatus Siliceabacter maunaloa]